MRDFLQARGYYLFRCWSDRGKLLWEKSIDNVVATVGKNLAFNTFLNGSSYTVTGPYMGLIDSTGFTGVAVTDTMASHPGWNEATYYGQRLLCTWAPAINGSISLAGPNSYVIPVAASVQGAFINFGPGAITTIGDTGGTLWSAGVFSGGAASMPAGSNLQVYYTASM
jgi:hypothetical protein